MLINEKSTLLILTTAADFAAKLEAADEQDRAAQLSAHAPLYAAGLGPPDAAGIAKVVQAALDGGGL